MAKPFRNGDLRVMEQRRCTYDKCGGCMMCEKSYEQTLREKKKYIEELLSKFCKVNEISSMYYPYNYRNKVHSTLGKTQKGGITTGIYKEGTHEIVPIDKCLINDKKADEIILTIRNLANEFKMQAYDEDRHTGLLRHVMVRRGASSRQIMVVLVTPTENFPSRKNFVAKLLELHPDITTVIQSINPAATSMVLGNYEKVLYGKGYIEDTLMGYTFRISARSFYQVNKSQTEMLYKTAINGLGLTGKESVIDAYCGIGTISLAVSKNARYVIGVELNLEAVKDAKENAKRNNIKNVSFFCDDAGDYMLELASEGKRIDAVIMDPPRSGSTTQFMDSVVRMSPDKIAYISCNPETLARDLNYFTIKGYRVKECTPVDMFGFTKHVEVICILTK